MNGLTTTHSFPAALEDGSTVRIEATTHTPDGRRVMFDKDGLAYTGGRTALKLVRSPRDDREPVGTSYVEPIEPNTLIVSVYDEKHGGGPVAEKVVTPLGRGSDDGRRLYRDGDGVVYVQRSATGGQSARLSGVVAHEEVSELL